MAFWNRRMYSKDGWAVAERSRCSTPRSLERLWVFAETRDTRWEKVYRLLPHPLRAALEFPRATSLSSYTPCSSAFTLFFLWPCEGNDMKIFDRCESVCKFNSWFWRTCPNPTAKQSEPRAASGLLPPGPPSHPGQCPAQLLPELYNSLYVMGFLISVSNGRLHWLRAFPRHLHFGWDTSWCCSSSCEMTPSGSTEQCFKSGSPPLYMD